MKDLLILNCSKSKDPDLNSLPAIERYNGVAFRVVRKFLKQESDSCLDIFILSAKFGLISGNELIPYYDQKMTKARSQELVPSVKREFNKILQTELYKRCLLCMSKDYLEIFKNCEEKSSKNLTISIATGTIGRKLSTLHQWLYGQAPKYLHPPQDNTIKGSAILKGVKLHLSIAEVLAIARQALIEKKGKPYNYQTWYILVDEQKISPKWLVSQLTGLPVSSFHSIKARQMLQQLGIEIYSELSN